MPTYIGTSGWSYDEWKDDFYAGVPRKRWLQHYAQTFDTVEVNGTFYRLQSESTLQKWHDETPDDFCFAIKGHRYITHRKRFLDPRESVVTSRDNADPLGEKLSALVWQLPASFGREFARLEAFADALTELWPQVRHAIEFRDTSWFDGDVAACMREHDLAVCISDAADWPLWEEVTADFVYLRFHGHTRTYASKYSTGLLREWAHKTRGWLDEGRDVYAYFDNTAEGAAHEDASRFRQMVRE